MHPNLTQMFCNREVFIARSSSVLSMERCPMGASTAMACVHIPQTTAPRIPFPLLHCRCVRTKKSSISPFTDLKMEIPALWWKLQALLEHHGWAVLFVVLLTLWARRQFAAFIQDRHAQEVLREANGAYHDLGLRHARGSQ